MIIKDRKSCKTSWFPNPLGGPRAGTEELLSGGWCLKSRFADLDDEEEESRLEEFLKIRLRVATRLGGAHGVSNSSWKKIRKLEKERILKIK